MKTAIAALIKNTPLAIIAIGIFLLILGAAGGSAYLKLEVKELSWQITLAIMGFTLVAGGFLSHWKQDRWQSVTADKSTDKQENTGGRIEGKYYAEGNRNYVNTIKHL
jgi:ABC-type uncharacterized transport system permease subunit